jgi:hypothetical protein
MSLRAKAIHHDNDNRVTARNEWMDWIELRSTWGKTFVNQGLAHYSQFKVKANRPSPERKKVTKTLEVLRNW